MPKPTLEEIKNPPPEGTFRHKIVTKRKARKEHRCKVCPKPIEKGMEYCEITDGGSGLGGLKFPDRTHTWCVVEYFDKYLEKEEKVAPYDEDKRAE